MDGQTDVITESIEYVRTVGKSFYRPTYSRQIYCSRCKLNVGLGLDGDRDQERDQDQDHDQEM